MIKTIRFRIVFYRTLEEMNIYGILPPLKNVSRICLSSESVLRKIRNRVMCLTEYFKHVSFYP